jgi:hypothetical protein
MFWYTPSQNFIGILYFFRIVFYALFYLYLKAQIKAEPAVKGVLKKGILGAIALIAVSTVLQYFLYPDLRNITYLGWDPHYLRAVGTFLDPPITASLLGMSLIYLLTTGSQKKSHVWIRRILLGSLVFLFLLTYSRGGYVALFITAGIGLFSQKKKLVLALFFVLLISLLFLLPKQFGEGVNLTRSSTVASRIVDYQEAFDIWLSHPVMGVGYNRIRYVREARNYLTRLNFDQSHAGSAFSSSFLTILVASGAVGLFIFLKALFKTARQSVFGRYSIIFLSIASLSDNVMLTGFVLFFWLMMYAEDQRSLL